MANFCSLCNPINPEDDELVGPLVWSGACGHSLCDACFSRLTRNRSMIQCPVCPAPRLPSARARNERHKQDVEQQTEPLEDIFNMTFTSSNVSTLASHAPASATHTRGDAVPMELVMCAKHDGTYVTLPKTEARSRQDEFTLMMNIKR